MNLHRARVKEYLKAIEQAGAELVGAEETGKHYKLILSARNKTRFFIIANSPSCPRGVLNFRSEVRKWIRTISNE